MKLVWKYFSLAFNELEANKSIAENRIALSLKIVGLRISTEPIFIFLIGSVKLKIQNPK
jgi:hypothetical protein